MKKLFLVLAFMLALGMGANVMAAEGPLNHSETITVQATVAPYAKIKWGDEVPAKFSGAANEQTQGYYYFTLETNCAVGFALDTTALTQTIDDVVYEIDRRGIQWGVKKLNRGSGFYGWLTGTRDHNHWRAKEFQDIGITDYYLTFRATTGNISDQHAGTYTANVTITITSLEG
ncbi:MAG: hypothetical protein GX998_03715 [Firmicutes bacterium]|nr:hypothetical protein [Bacillota bacterium]